MLQARNPKSQEKYNPAFPSRSLQSNLTRPGGVRSDSGHGAGVERQGEDGFQRGDGFLRGEDAFQRVKEKEVQKRRGDL